MKILLSCLLLSAALTAFAQVSRENRSFKKTEYPASKFLITADTFSNGPVQIITVMVAPKSNGTRDFLCRSWLTVKKNGKTLTQKFYDIEPVGGCAGLYLPDIQPLKQLFFVSKFGDYEGETIVIDTAGRLVKFSGGTFSISSDKNYLFSIWDSDLSGLSVYDLKNRQVCITIEADNEQQFEDVYFQDGKYYISVEDNTTVYLVDVNTKKVITLKKPIGFLKKENKLRTINKIDKCSCGR